MRGRVVAVVQIEWLDQPAAHHQRPQAVGHVAGKEPVVPTENQLCQLFAAIVGWHRPQVLFLLVRLDLVFLARSDGRLVDLTLAKQPRTRDPRITGENRLERNASTGPLGQHTRLLLVGLEQVRSIQEGVDAVVVLLQVIVDQRVVVALGTLQIDAEEHSADLAGHLVHFDTAVHQELRPTSLFGIDGVGPKNLRSQNVPGLVRFDRSFQKRLPLPTFHLAVAATLREHHVQDIGHPSHVSRRSHQAVDNRRPFRRGLVIEENTGFSDRRNPSDNGQIQTAQKLAIIARTRDQSQRTFGHQPVHLHVQRIGSRYPGRGNRQVRKKHHSNQNTGRWAHHHWEFHEE